MIHDLVTGVFNDYLVNQVVTLRIILNINTTLGYPSMLRFICKAVALARIFPHFDFIIEENVTRRK
jgi:hypothetical protein